MAATFFLWHLFLRAFLAHLRICHLPGSSVHEADVLVEVCGMRHVDMSEGQPAGLDMGLQVRPGPAGAGASIFVHMKGYCLLLSLAPSRKVSHASAHRGGAGGGDGGYAIAKVMAEGAE